MSRVKECHSTYTLLYVIDAVVAWVGQGFVGLMQCVMMALDTRGQAHNVDVQCCRVLCAVEALSQCIHQQLGETGPHKSTDLRQALAHSDYVSSSLGKQRGGPGLGAGAHSDRRVVGNEGGSLRRRADLVLLLLRGLAGRRHHASPASSARRASGVQVPAQHRHPPAPPPRPRARRAARHSSRLAPGASSALRRRDGRRRGRDAAQWRPRARAAAAGEEGEGEEAEVAGTLCPSTTVSYSAPLG